MKILIVGPIGSPILQRLVTQLIANGCEVWVASHNIKGTRNKINLGDLKGFNCFLQFWKINKIVKAINPDLVHAHVLNHYGLMCTFQRKPLVVALWGSEVMLAPYQGSIFRRIVFKCINWLVLKRADRCHASSENIVLEAERQCKGVTDKSDIFYWGFPLDKPAQKEIKKIELSLKAEFNIPDSGLIVFPRGVSDVYNPSVVARIVNVLTSKLDDPKRIVVLKAFASPSEEYAFRLMVNNSRVTYISRILSSSELYVLYKKSDIHVSIPKSDSLGSGVVEPALLGSFPVLSNLSPYVDYIKNNKGLILESYDDKSIDELCQKIIDYCEIGRSEVSESSTYSSAAVIAKFYSMYEKSLVRP